MIRNKRDLATLERLWRKFGDVKISEAIHKLRNPRAGQPIKWDMSKVVDVFLGVEAIKSIGLKPERAFNEFTSYSKLTLPQVKYAYAKGRHIAKPFLGHLDQSIDMLLNGVKHTDEKGEPELRDFLRKLQSRTKTPSIR
ncbi:hypothetical protein [Bradyrhizobium sp. OAE829]|uniref:hypothetical protein n=1 Tax=Bradyrhizobium sp. OAE829 TaxID=2663807 RepID=UPI001789CE82